MTPRGARASSLSPLYEMVIVAESGPPPGVEAGRRCAECGREEFEAEKREFVLTPSMLPGTDVFYLATTLWIVVADRVRQFVRDSGLTNVDFSEIECRPK